MQCKEPATTRMEVCMAAVATVPARGRVGVGPWLVLAAAVALLWLVSLEGGLVSDVIGGTPAFLHELFHDGRHLLGVPCH